MTNPLDSTSALLQRGSGHVETEMTDQIVAMSLEQGKYFAFRGTARRVWDLLETPLSREDLIHALAADYDVTPEQCRRDCEPFLRDLLAHGLIEEATE